MKPKHRLAVAVVLSLCLAPAVSARADDAPTTQPEAAATTQPAEVDAASIGLSIEPAGVSVARPDVLQLRGARMWHRWEAPVRVGVLIKVPKGQLIGMDEGASKLTTFTDDVGADLAKEDKEQQDRVFFGQSGLGSLMVGEGGKMALLNITGRKAPAAGNRELFVAADLVLLYSDGTTKVESVKGVSTKAGTEVKAGPITMTVDDRNFGNGENVMGLRYGDDGGRISKIRILDSEGTDIGGENGWGRSVQNDVVTMTRYYRLPQETKTVTVEVTYFKDVRRVRTPLALSVRAGL
ncbi:MAG: hypothetical protein BIFFINMI_00733 [Phycisphaerae bacterium]|nr:hypothetical protein [Phycisphaerae bacterium]